MYNEKTNNFFFIVNNYNKCGLRRSCKSLMKYISVYILLPLLLIFYGMVLFNFRFMNNNVFEVSQVFESISTFGQLVVRKLILLTYGKDVDEIIEAHSQLWKHDLFGKKLEQHYQRKIIFRINLIRFFWIFAVFTSFIFLLTPFFVKNTPLPNASWIPANNEILRIFMFCLEMIFYYELIFLVGVFDGFFLFTCLDLQIQFDLLSRTVTSLRIGINNSKQYEEFCLNKLKHCFIHHRFLLGIHKKLNGIFSEYFVCQFLLNIGCVCIQFFVISDELRFSNFTQIVRSILYIAVLNIQDALFFIPASDVEAEAEKLPNQIYGMDWYNAKNKQIPKYILFWLMKAQVPIRMSGAGLFTVNKNLFLQIPRISFSFSTILHRTKEID